MSPTAAPRSTFPVAASLLVAAIFCAFLPALFAGFVAFDDPTFVTDNPHVRGVSLKNIVWAITNAHGGHWHPLTWLSWSFDFSIYSGYTAWGFHLTNVVLHAASSVLVYAIALKLLRSVRTQVIEATTLGIHLAAVFAAAFFALHPLRVESVAWVTERRDVLSATFLLAAALAYLHAAHVGQFALRSRRLLLCTHVFLACSLLSKAWGMSFFVIALVLDVYPLARLSPDPRLWKLRDVSRLLIEKLPMIVFGIIAAALAANAQNQAFATKTFQEWSLQSRLAQSVLGFGWYLAQSLWPHGHSVLYELPLSGGLPFSDSRVLVGAAILAAVLLLIVCVKPWRRPLLAGIVVYTVLILPVLGIVQSGEQLVADRYALLACLPLPILLAGGSLAWLHRVPEPRRTFATKAAVGIASALLLLLSLNTFNQCHVWRNNESLWSHAASVSPTPGVLTNLAQELFDRKPSDARTLLERAVELNPKEGRAWFLLAQQARSSKDFVRAERCYTMACESLPQKYMAYVNLGAMQLKDLGRPQDAVKSFEAAVHDVEQGGRRPLSYLPYLALGDAYNRTGNPVAARDAFTKALQGNDTKAFAHAELKKLETKPRP